MAAYTYTVRGLSASGPVCLSGEIILGEVATLEELLREIEAVSGTDLDPAVHNAVLIVNEKRADWDTNREIPLPDGSRLIWITPAFGG